MALNGSRRSSTQLSIRSPYWRPVLLMNCHIPTARARDTVALLCQISREEGLTLCVSLHNLELAREFLPRLIGMRAGNIVFDRPTAELKDEDFRTLYDLSPEEMLEEYDFLNLAQIHAALSYYYENSEEIDAQLKADREWDERFEREKAEFLKKKASSSSQ